MSSTTGRWSTATVAAPPRPVAYRPALPEPERTSWRPLIGFAAGWLLVASAVVGIVVYARWQRERNRPVNRLRRQAKYAAAYVGDRLPGVDDIREYLPDEDVRPAGGLGLLLLAGALWAARALRSSEDQVEQVHQHRHTHQHRHGRNGHSNERAHAASHRPSVWSTVRFGRKS